jgi:hypothetical protein
MTGHGVSVNKANSLPLLGASSLLLIRIIIHFVPESYEEGIPKLLPKLFSSGLITS